MKNQKNIKMAGNTFSNKAVVYLRVSSKGQEEGFSLDAQEKMCRDYAQKQGLIIVKMWKGAESAWGKIERANFKEMIAYVKKHREIGHIIFDIEDRMTRNYRDKLDIDELVFSGFGVTVHFARTNSIYAQDASPEKKFALNIGVAVSAKLSDDISRKTAMGMREKAEQGIYPACAPIGYLNNPRTRRIDIDPVRARYIHKIFEMAASGSYSLEMIADKLYADGFRNKQGKKVVKATIHKILKNTIYYGPFKWGDKTYLGKHKPIITKDLYERANTALSRFHRPHLTKRNHPFANLLHCKQCGCSIVGDFAQQKYLYYRCSFAKGKHQHKPYLRDFELDDLLVKVVQNIKISPDIAAWLQKAVEHKLKHIEKSENKELGQLRISLAKERKKLEILYEKAVERDYSAAMIHHDENLYNMRIGELEQQIQNRTINPQEIRQKSINVLELVCNIGTIYQKIPLGEKRDFLCQIAEDFVLDDKKIEVIYRPPFNIFAAGNKKCLEFKGNSQKSSKHIILGPLTIYKICVILLILLKKHRRERIKKYPLSSKNG